VVRKRAEIIDSPRPGSSISMVPTRAITIMKAVASARSNEMSVRMGRL
jgi:hypothetical protein